MTTQLSKRDYEDLRHYWVKMLLWNKNIDNWLQPTMSEYYQFKFNEVLDKYRTKK